MRHEASVAPPEIIYPWDARKAKAVDQILLPWATLRGLNVFTSAQESEGRWVRFCDDEGDQFQIRMEQPDDLGNLLVEASIVSRSERRLWNREARRFVSSNSVPTAELEKALEAAFGVILGWVKDEGHTITLV